MIIIYIIIFFSLLFLLSIASLEFENWQKKKEERRREKFWREIDQGVR